MPSFLLTEGEPLRVPRGRTEIRAMPEGQDSLRLDALGDADVDTLTTNTWLVRPGEDASTLTLTLPEVGAPGGRMPVTLHIRGRNGADDTTVDLPPIDVAGLTAVPILEISPVHGDPSRVAVRLLAPVRGPSMPVSAQAEQARTVARTVIGDDARGFGSDVTDHDGQRIVVDGSASMAGHLRSGLVARIVDTIDGVSLVRRGSRRSTLLLGLPDRLVTVVGSGDVTAQGFGGALAEEVATRPLTTGFRWDATWHESRMRAVVVTDSPQAIEGAADGAVHAVLLMDRATLTALGGSPSTSHTVWDPASQDDAASAEALTTALYGHPTKDTR